ncbi:MAG: hypothetical protein ACKVWV_02575 [Planctomycetota bacterium]
MVHPAPAKVAEVSAPAKAAAPLLSLTENQAIATLRVLVRLSKSGGTIQPARRAGLERAFQRLKLPANITPSSLLDETCDLDVQLYLFRTLEARESLYRSAVAMVLTESGGTTAEQRMLDHIRTTLHIADESAAMTRRVFDAGEDPLLPSDIETVAEPARRAKEVKADIAKSALQSALVGSIPTPGQALATDVALIALQVKLVRDIAQRFGHPLDEFAARALLGGLGLGTGARVAVSNVAKHVPVWAAAVGASASFASTKALGEIADAYFRGGAKVAIASMQSDFDAAELEAGKAYATQKERVESERARNAPALQTLDVDLSAGRVTPREYAARIEQFARA